MTEPVAFWSDGLNSKTIFPSNTNGLYIQLNKMSLLPNECYCSYFADPLVAGFEFRIIVSPRITQIIARILYASKSLALVGNVYQMVSLIFNYSRWAVMELPLLCF